MSTWLDYGFRENPYSTRPIEPTAEGLELLVGRTREIAALHAALTASDTHPTIEGSNGVGKTSLAQVTAYAAKRGAEGGHTKQLFLPVHDVFQVTPQNTPQGFVLEVCAALADAFDIHRGVLQRGDFVVPSGEDISHWRRAVAGRSSGGDAFADARFAQTMFAWVGDCFPSAATGAFVCVLDNLELLETSVDAKRFLEALRDPLLRKRGLRWVLCGARGVISGAAGSPRLDGVLGEPLQLPHVEPDDAAEILQKRIEIYRLTDEYFMPVDPEGFAIVYAMLNHNLRDSFKLCQDFVVDFTVSGQAPHYQDDQVDRLKFWLQGVGVKHLRSADKVTSSDWGTFKRMADRRKLCGLDEWQTFGAEDLEGFTAQVKSLKRANLVDEVDDQADDGRTLIRVTTRGWLVYHARRW